MSEEERDEKEGNKVANSWQMPKHRTLTAPVNIPPIKIVRFLQCTPIKCSPTIFCNSTIKYVLDVVQFDGPEGAVDAVSEVSRGGRTRGEHVRK
jgi:hypothetical protein